MQRCLKNMECYVQILSWYKLLQLHQSPCSYTTVHTPAETLTHWSYLTTDLLMPIADAAGEQYISHLTRFLMTSNKYTAARTVQKNCSQLLPTAYFQDLSQTQAFFQVQKATEAIEILLWLRSRYIFGFQNETLKKVNRDLINSREITTSIS